MRLIGLNGPKGAGKSTIGRFLAETQGFVRAAFADPLKDGAAAIFDLPRAMFDDPTVKDCELQHPFLLKDTPRSMVDDLGRACRAAFGDRVLIRLMEDQWYRQLHANRNLHVTGLVITDVRLQAEADWIRFRGGAIWHIHRPEYLPDAGPSLYESGLPICMGDLTLNNDGDIDELHDLVAAHLEAQS